VAVTTGNSANVYPPKAGTYMVAVRAVNSSGSSALTNATSATTINTVAGKISVLFSPSLAIDYATKKAMKVKLFKHIIFDTTIASVDTVVYLPATMEGTQSEVDSEHVLPGTYSLKAILYTSLVPLSTEKESSTGSITINGDVTLLVSETDGVLTVEEQ